MPRWLRRSFLQLNIGNGSDRESRWAVRARSECEAAHGIQSELIRGCENTRDHNESAPIAAQESYARNDEGWRPALSQTLSDPLLNFGKGEVVPSI